MYQSRVLCQMGAKANAEKGSREPASFAANVLTAPELLRKLESELHRQES
jgi:hypothetical protein